MVYDKTRYDVVVVGGGPSGISAAISASKNGAKTLLVEKEGFIGGMTTSGLLSTWGGKASSSNFEIIKSQCTVKKGHRSVFDPEKLKYIYLKELEKRNVDLLLHVQLSRVNKINDRIDSIEVLGKFGTMIIEGNIFIDSTGDGDLAYLSGVDYTKGRESDGLMQPMTLLFTIGNIDEEKAVYPSFNTHPHLEELMLSYVEEGSVSKPAGHVILMEGYHKGTATVNMTNAIRVDGTSTIDLTKAEIHTRKQVMPIIRFLREQIPGYENCYLLHSANHVGVRETRHFQGDFTITEQHIQENAIFDDWLVSNIVAGFGNHNLTGSGRDEHNVKYNGEPYTIPYGSFVAKGIGNLFLNGRCISGTHMAHASYRLVPVCFAMGQGVGTASALCTKQGISIRDLNIKSLQNVLINQGIQDPNQN